MRKYFLKRTEPEEAKKVIFETLKKLLTPGRIGTEHIPVVNGSGRILAKSLRAKFPVPREYLSAMDGIATRADLTKGASPSNPIVIKEGDYVPINTGNLIPEGFDCVIRREDYWEEGSSVIVRTPHQRYQNVRIPGEDVLPFDLIAENWRIIDGKIIALALQAGVEEVEVLRPLVALFIPTGNELLKPGSEYQRGKVYETNSFIFADILKKLGIIVKVHDVVPDKPTELERVFEEASKYYHMVFVCGGTSAGEYDFTAQILKEKGELLIHGLNLRPGKPFVFGVLDHTPFFGVPGYPGAALFSYEYVVLPVLKDFLGYIEGSATLQAKAGRKISASEGEDHLFSVVVSKVESDYCFYPIKQGSGPLSPFIRRSGYVVVEKGLEGLEENTFKKVYLTVRKDLVDKSILFVGSHDLSVDILKEILWREWRVPLNIVNAGSLGGMNAIRKGAAHIAGVHLLDEKDGTYNISFAKALELKNFTLLPFLKREQGFLVREEFEGKIKSFKDIREMELTFVTRQRGSGTRILTDYLLKLEGIDPSEIKGYGNDVLNHLEVGHYVKMGIADVGVGIKPIAKLLGLSFIPIAEEEYDLLIFKDFLRDDRFHYLSLAIRSKEFMEEITILGGYKHVFSEVPKLEG
ncbi:MAG: molybdopterin biosynthesis protein [bacterium]|nr:molybdopterin biosynthesis protein [bacterium]